MLLLRHRTRKIVFRGLAVLYFFVATWLLLFANGYRFQTKPFVISRTGNILATFEPTDARIHLDDSADSYVSPARIRSIFPGIHKISIRSEGYLPYERSIRVEPKKTSFISNIYLIKNSEPQLSAHKITPTPPFNPHAEILAAIGKDVRIETTMSSGTRIIVDNTISSRDLGAGAWKILNADKNVLALSRLDTNEIQFRAWKNLDEIITTLPGNSIIAIEFDGVRSFLAISDFEIWNFDTNRTAAELVYRFSTPVLSAYAVPETNLIIATLPDKITAFNLGDHHYIPTILFEGSVMASTISPDGKSLLFEVTEGAKSKTYERVLY